MFPVNSIVSFWAMFAKKRIVFSPYMSLHLINTFKPSIYLNYHSLPSLQKSKSVLTWACRWEMCLPPRRLKERSQSETRQRSTKVILIILPWIHPRVDSQTVSLTLTCTFGGRSTYLKIPHTQPLHPAIFEHISNQQNVALKKIDVIRVSGVRLNTIILIFRI